ncbi:MAG: hypothetical protein FJW36_03545 [Acidobacteria bacterium]|nr:hypothetical protein [Acidobacteriota bacterium]
MSSKLRRWLVPDIALILSAITMLYCLTSFTGMQLLFRDSDTGWHIRNGETVLATGVVPTQETYSYSMPGGAWYAWEWLADCFMAQAHILDGMRGVFLLYLIVIGIVSWLWFQLVWVTKSWFLLGASATWVMLTTCNIHWLARPHMMGWIFLLLAVLAAERVPAKLNVWWVLAVSLTSMLWANIHGSFFLASGIFVVYAAEKWLRKDESWKVLLSFAAISMASSFVNPYGWHVHAHIIEYLQDKELLSRIGEFQTFNFHVEGAEALVIGMLMVAAGISLNVIQGNYARAVMCLIVFAGALRSARGLPLLALVGVPFAISAITTFLEGIPALKGVRQYNHNLRAMDSGFRGWLLIPVIVVLFIAAARSPLFPKGAGFPEANFPVSLTAKLEGLPPSARIFSSDKFGGFLIYQFAGQRKVFVDGRNDYYGAEFCKNYLNFLDGKAGWEAYLNQWKFTHALLPKDSALAEILKLKGWLELGKDPVAILLEKGPK